MSVEHIMSRAEYFIHKNIISIFAHWLIYHNIPTYLANKPSSAELCEKRESTHYEDAMSVTLCRKKHGVHNSEIPAIASAKPRRLVLIFLSMAMNIVCFIEDELILRSMSSLCILPLKNLYPYTL